MASTREEDRAWREYLEQARMGGYVPPNFYEKSPEEDKKDKKKDDRSAVEKFEDYVAPWMLPIAAGGLVGGLGYLGHHLGATHPPEVTHSSVEGLDRSVIPNAQETFDRYMDQIKRVHDFSTIDFNNEENRNRVTDFFKKYYLNDNNQPVLMSESDQKNYEKLMNGLNWVTRRHIDNIKGLYSSYKPSLGLSQDFPETFHIPYLSFKDGNIIGKSMTHLEAKKEGVVNFDGTDKASYKEGPVNDYTKQHIPRGMYRLFNAKGELPLGPNEKYTTDQLNSFESMFRDLGGHHYYHVKAGLHPSVSDRHYTRRVHGENIVNHAIKNLIQDEVLSYGKRFKEGTGKDIFNDSNIGESLLRALYTEHQRSPIANTGGRGEKTWSHDSKNSFISLKKTDDRNNELWNELDTIIPRSIEASRYARIPTSDFDVNYLIARAQFSKFAGVPEFPRASEI